MADNNDANNTKKKKTISKVGNYVIIAFLAGAVTAGGIFLAGSKSGHIVGTVNTDVEPKTTSEEVIDTTDDSEEMNITNIDAEDFYDIVNEDVYNKLMISKENFEKLYSDGEVSYQMKDLGIETSEENYKYIDDAMIYTYSEVCSYIENYDNGNYDTCYQVGKSLCDEYVTHLSPTYLYSFLVTPKLNEKYVSDFYQYDSDGSIELNNGNKIRLVGKDDQLIRITRDDDIATRFDYYSELPITILDTYKAIEDKDNTCFVVNVSKTDRLCQAEVESIRTNAMEAYDISDDDLAIIWNEEAESWEYYNNTTLEDIALLDNDTNNRFDNYWDIMYALYNDSDIDIYEIDAAIDSLDEKHEKIR